MTGNIFDWLTWRGDLSFKAAPFSEVDGLALSILVFLPLEGIVPDIKMGWPISLREAADSLLSQEEVIPSVQTEKDRDFLRLMADSERFGHLSLFAMESIRSERREAQFAGLGIDTGDGHIFIAFRGTDLSLVGWKESFNMSFLQKIPSQELARDYVEKVARLRRGRIRLGGHSKGGNLAAYAAAYASGPVKKRIVSIWNNDGPGFHEDLLKEKAFESIKSRFYSFLPQSSIIGMLLEHNETFAIIRSSQTGILQHDPYSWQIIGPRFQRVEALDSRAQFFDKTIKDWLEKIDVDKREVVIEVLYELVKSTESKSVSDLSSNWLKNAWLIIQRFNSLDAKSRAMLMEGSRVLFRSARENLALAFQRS